MYVANSARASFVPDCTPRAWSDFGPRKTQLVVYLLSTAFVASELSDLALEKPEKNDCL